MLPTSITLFLTCLYNFPSVFLMFICGITDPGKTYTRSPGEVSTTLRLVDIMLCRLVILQVSQLGPSSSFFISPFKYCSLGTSSVSFIKFREIFVKVHFIKFILCNITRLSIQYQWTFYINKLCRIKHYFSLFTPQNIPLVTSRVYYVKTKVSV